MSTYKKKWKRKIKEYHLRQSGHVHKRQEIGQYKDFKYFKFNELGDGEKNKELDGAQSERYMTGCACAEAKDMA